MTTWIIEGHSSTDIVEALARDYPDARAAPLIASATKLLIAVGSETDEDLLRGFALEATRLIYQKSLEVADHQTALRALKQLADLATK